MIGWLRGHRYGLGILLAFLWLASWGMHLHAEWWSSQWPHDEVPWLIDFYRTTMENWQSEFLQLLTMVVGTAYLIFAGSTESKDGDERLEAKVDEIRGQVEAIKMAVWSTNTRLDEQHGTEEAHG